MSLSSCPSREQLSDFALGLGDAFDAIAAHLDDCAACEAIVQELEATLGAVVEKLRLAAPEDRYAAESACRKAMALVAARDWQSNSMDGTDDSRAQESSDALAYARPVDDSAALHAGPASASSSTDRFRILRAHAAGSLGKVSVALDQELNREVALKEIQERFADNPDSRARFLLEAEITGGLEHPGIVPIYSLGNLAGGRPFYAMRFIRGDSLKDAIERFHKNSSTDFTDYTDKKPDRSQSVKSAKSADRFAGLDFRQLLGRFIDVCNAIAYAHSRGVLHRDLKPGNIMLGEFGETMVVDWGLAKAGVQPQTTAPQDRQASTRSSDAPEAPGARLLRPEWGSENMTGTGGVLGTYAYMSPEQAAGRLDQLGPATDIYSLGATLYHLLTGRPPFERRAGDVNGAAIRDSIQRGAFATPRQVKAAIPAPLEAVCVKAMALDAAGRYASAKDLAKDVERWLADEPVIAWPEPARVRLGRWLRRHKRALTAAGSVATVAGLLILVTFAGAFFLIRESRDEAVELAKQRDRQRLRAETALVKLQFELALQQPEENRDFSVLNTAQLLGNPIVQENRLLQDSLRLHLGNWLGQQHRLKGILAHKDAVLAVAFSPDGQTLLTGSRDKTARLWDTGTGKPVGPPLMHQDWVVALAFSPDGKTVVTGSQDRTARLWETATGKQIGPPLQHQGWVYAVSFSPDGKTVLTGTFGGTARLWDTATGKSIGSPLQHQESAEAFAFSRDGKVVLTGSADQTARLWETGTGKPLGPPLQHQGRVHAAAFSPDGKTVLTGSWDATARLWDVFTGKSLGAPLQRQNGVNSVAFSPDGKTVLTGSHDETARLWETATGRPLGPPMQHQHGVTAVAFSPDGKHVLTGSNDSTARLWETATREPLPPPMQHKDDVLAVAFSPDGKTVLTGSAAMTAGLWEAATDKPFGKPVKHDHWVVAVAFSPDGKTILTGSVDKTARLSETATGNQLGPSLKHRSTVNAVAFSPDGQTALTGSADKTARLWETATGNQIGPTFSHTEPVLAAAFSPDGHTVLTSTRDKTARLWDTATGKQLGPSFEHQRAIKAVAFSPNGKAVLTGSLDKTAQVWETVTGKQIGPPLSHQGAVVAVAFSPNGQTVLTGSWDKSARLWETASGKQLGPPFWHQGRVTAVAFSPDGNTVLTGSADNTARLWAAPRPVQGEPVRVLLSVQVITATELDDFGQVRVLDAETWQKGRQQLEALGGPPQ
jgi:eukaryotic-like serine/threonine-protein kinase